MAIKYARRPYYVPNGQKINQHVPRQGPSKFSQNGIFGLKIYHLATLFKTCIGTL
jgi:hypothetical protein